MAKSINNTEAMLLCEKYWQYCENQFAVLPIPQY